MVIIWRHHYFCIILATIIFYDAEVNGIINYFIKLVERIPAASGAMTLAVKINPIFGPVHIKFKMAKEK